MGVWANLIGYQLVWFIAVIAAGRAVAWPGVIAALAFALVQLAVSSRRALELRLIAGAVVLGVVLDGSLAASGLIHYAAGRYALPPGGAPLWILAMWVAFSTTLTRGLAWLQGRPLAAMALGFIGAPLAYLGAERGWGAVVLAPPVWRAELVLAVGWALALWLLLRLIARGSVRVAGTRFGSRLARRLR